MALDCEKKLEADIAADCDNKPRAGIEVNVVAINFEDIDRTTSTLDGVNNLLITNIGLTGVTTGFNIEGVKQVQGASFEFVVKEDSMDAFKHSFVGVVLNPSVENKKSLANMASGGRYVFVVEKLWKGIDQDDAFEVLGWDTGMYMAEIVWNTQESDGVIKFTMASLDGYEEGEMTRNVLETDYATTKIAFDAKFG